MTVRWAIWGPGRQARVLVPEFARASGADLVAVGSRSIERAEAFAQDYHVPQVYGSLAELAMAPDIDAVFLTSPHSSHVDEAVHLAHAGKHLIIEKSMATSPAGVRTIMDAAAKNHIFCMEGMWTRFLPAMCGARELIAQGAIGKVLAVQGDLHAYRQYDPQDRLFNPALGGGALLDLGVYVVACAHDFLGVPDRVRAVGHRLPNGVDGTCAMTLGYDHGAVASLSVSFESPGPGRFAVMGTHGWLDIPPRFHHPEQIVLYRNGKEAETITPTLRGRGYVYEVEMASQLITAGRVEAPEMSLADSLQIAEVLAEAARQF
ncbi:MAG: Gfo/Idh/MocA family protein [Propionibacteriaceae bacterium]